MTRTSPYKVLLTLIVHSTAAAVVLLLLVTLSSRTTFAQTQQFTGAPPTSLLASDISLFNNPCCGRLDSRVQFVLKNGELIWAEGSETPIRKMSAKGGEITTLVKWTGSPLNAITRGQAIYWIEKRYHPNTGQLVYRLNRTSLDGLQTTVLDEGPRTQNDPGTLDILVTDTDAYWVNSLDTNECNGTICISGKKSWIRKVPLNGTPATNLVTPPLDSSIVSLSGDATYLYWQEDGIYMGPSRVRKILLSGGPAIDIVDGTLNNTVENWDSAGGITVAGAELFFAGNVYPSGYRLMKIPVSGGDITTLTSISGSYEAAPRKIAANATNVYWADMAAIKTVSRSGGDVSLLVSGLGLPTALLIADNRIFWAEDYCCGTVFTGSIKTIPIAGGMPSTLVDELGGVRSLDVVSGSLFFIEGSQTTPTGVGSGTMLKASLATGMVTPLATAVIADAATPIAVDDNNVYFADASGLKKASLHGGIVELLAAELEIGTVSALTADGQFVYLLSGRRNPIVRRIPVNGGPIEDVTSPASVTRHASGKFILNNGYFYWIEHSYTAPANDAIMKASVSGGQALAVVSGTSLGDMDVANGFIYFIEGGFPNAVRKISVDGGLPITLGGAHDGAALAVEGASAYWIDFFDLDTVSVSGGSQRMIMANAGGIALALSSTAIYWMDYEGNIVTIDRAVSNNFVNVVAPAADEIWPIRSKRFIRWGYAGIGKKVNVSLSLDGGNTWKSLFRNKPNNGSITWKVTKPAAGEAIIRVCSTTTRTFCDNSEKFTIQ